MTINFKAENIQIDDSWKDFFTNQNDELRKIEILIGDSYTPNPNDIFKIFRLPVEKIKHVIVGQDPYPQFGVATGRSFEVEHENWNNVNDSLKAILSSIYYHSTSKYLELNQILEIIDNGTWNIEQPNTIFKNLEAKQGVFFLNKSLTCPVEGVNLHRNIWAEFTSELVKYLDSQINCNWLLWGGEAKSLAEFISNKPNIITTIHPAYCYRSQGEERTNRIKEFAINSGLNLILKQIIKTNNMSAFKKGDPEYISNGNYSINGERFMSVWSYKKAKGIEPNTNSVNGSEGIQLSAQDITIYESEPDFGNFGMVYLYPYAVLEEFYS